jgi:hypothetical protein
MACLFWTTWALGGVRLWAQLGTTTIAVICIAITVWPSRDGSKKGLHTLLRFAPFWLGLFVATYIAIQGLNSSWVFAPTGTEGKLQAIAGNDIDWLPSGIDAPWWMMNPWRMFLIFTPCWLVVCAIWCGCRRPKAMRALLWAISINGMIFAIVGILQFTTHTDKMLWLFNKPVNNSMFWGTIVNPNHASAFMNLGLAAALTLFTYYTGRHGRDITRGGSYLMLIPISTIIGIGIFQAMSRAGIVSTCLIVLGFMMMLIWRLVRFLREGGNKGLLAVLCGVVLLLVGVALAGMHSAVDERLLRQEIKSLFAVANAPENDTRYFINEASVDLFKMHPVYGCGAGCYRYFINITQRNYPELMKNGKPVRIIYAHDDYMNALCDLGIVGAAPLFAGIIALPFFVFFFRKRGNDGAFFVGLAGILAVMLHAALEFFMQHPLVALQFAIFLAIVTRMACLNHNKITASETQIP